MTAPQTKKDTNNWRLNTDLDLSKANLAGFRKISLREECLPQIQAVSDLNVHHVDWLNNRLLLILGAEFRKIINEFEELYGRVPTKDELIQAAGADLGEDLYQSALRIEKEGDVK